MQQKENLRERPIRTRLLVDRVNETGDRAARRSRHSLKKCRVRDSEYWHDQCAPVVLTRGENAVPRIEPSPDHYTLICARQYAATMRKLETAIREDERRGHMKLLHYLMDAGISERTWSAAQERSDCRS